jgi:hypothetical protein
VHAQAGRQGRYYPLVAPATMGEPPHVVATIVSLEARGTAVLTKLCSSRPGRRTGSSLLAALALVLVAVVPAEAAAKKDPSCKRAGSRTVAQNGVARVYELKSPEAERRLYGCRRSTGKRVLLDTAGDDFSEYLITDYENVRLAGVRVAWASSSVDYSCKAACPPGYDGRSTSVRVYDLRRRAERAIQGADPLGRGLVLSRLGGVAWAVRDAVSGGVEIHASLRTGDDRVIDSGNIDPKSLAIEITIISWMRDGVEQFARLR